MTRLRWRLAELVAGAPLMRDPIRGKDGAVLVVRESGMTVIYTPDKFRIRSRRLPPHGGWQGALDFRAHRTLTTFAGLTQR